MSEWREVLLGNAPIEILDGDRGKNYPKKHEFLDEGFCLFLNTKNVTSSGFNFTDLNFITKEKDGILRKGKMERNDVVLTTRGTVGNVAFYNEKIIFDSIRINSGMVIIRPIQAEIHPVFNFQLFKYLTLDLSEFVSGSAQPQLPIRDLKQIPILLPPLPEQKAIAEVLSSLDDKIDLLHRQNKTLEQMAETLFRQWFVEEAGEDWGEGVLDDILTVKGGTTPSTKNADFWNGDIHWTTPKDLSINSPLFLMDTLRMISNAGLEKISSGLLPKGTLLLSSRAPVGYLAIAEIPLAINQGYIAIIDNNGFSSLFIYLWLKTNMDYVKSHSNGSTFQEISKTSFKALEIVIPPKDLRLKFDEIVNDNFNKIRTNSYQIRTLQSLRDTLLPKLMSGEVRIASNG
jgi:type I restriction enzyme S subunit